MSEKHSTLTHSHLQEILNYDEMTGLFTWKTTNTFRVRVGDVAGTLTNGYIQIQINYVLHPAHRLAVFYATGKYPTLHIDHINGVPNDNRLVNLREVNNAQNHQNIQRPRKDSSMRFIGVQRRDSSFAAKIQLDGKQIYLGRFPTEELAGQAYLEAKRKLHPYSNL